MPVGRGGITTQSCQPSYVLIRVAKMLLGSYNACARKGFACRRMGSTDFSHLS